MNDTLYLGLTDQELRQIADKVTKSVNQEFDTEVIERKVGKDHEYIMIFFEDGNSPEEIESHVRNSINLQASVERTLYEDEFHISVENNRENATRILIGKEHERFAIQVYPVSKEEGKEIGVIDPEYYMKRV
jgi:phenylpyruvate tautomerase PptA (4-oxalocrotonate tautomerase family)